jgi:hypothetical protein
MAALPPDVHRWIGVHFAAADVDAARELLAIAVDHAGATPQARLLRCAAVGSRGDLVQLRYLVGLLQIDYRDVIMFGEYDVVDGKLSRVRNLNEPLP